MAFRLARRRISSTCANPGLRGIAIDETGVCSARTRAGATSKTTRGSPPRIRCFGAIRHVAHYQVRNRGTVGGSLAHADPAAEMPCIAVTCEAELPVLGPSGERRIRAAEFFLGPLTTALAKTRSSSTFGFRHGPPAGDGRSASSRGDRATSRSRVWRFSTIRTPRGAQATFTSAWSAPADAEAPLRGRGALEGKRRRRRLRAPPRRPRRKKPIRPAISTRAPNTARRSSGTLLERALQEPL